MAENWKTERPGPDVVRYIVAASIREIRGKAGWSQERLAEEMRRAGHDWTRNTVSNTDRGTHPLEASELLALAAIFGVPVVDLIAPPSSAVDYKIEAGVSTESVRELLVGDAAAGEAQDWPAADELLAAWQGES